MAEQSLAILINRDIGTQAQAVLADMGLDIATAVDYFLRQVVHSKKITVSTNPVNQMPQINLSHFAETNNIQKEEIFYHLCASVDDSLIDINNFTGKPVRFGGWEGKVVMADDFNAPLDDFEDYM